MSKKLVLALIGVLVCGVAFAGTISQSFTQRQVRDPRQLETILEDNFAEIDTRTTNLVSTSAGVTADFDVDGSLTVGTNVTAGGVVDAASVTVDAGAGVDAQAAGALLIGAVTATSVEIADVGVATDIQGVLSVDGDATFDTTVNITSNLVITGTQLSMANIPTDTNSIVAGDLWSDSGTIKIR